MSMPDTRQYSFGSFWLDLEKRQLLHRNQPVTVTRKALDTLGVLVSNAGRVVTREELKRQVWGDTYVEEATIAQNIFTLRKTLGELQPGQNLIETVAGVGYRFSGQVQPYPAEKMSVDGGATETGIASPADKPSTRFLWAVAVILGLGLIASVWWWSFSYRRTTRVQSLAVLPFANFTGDSQEEYVAEGITDELLTDVGQIPGLRVISGRSAAQYGKNKSATEIARELHVDALVEGAVLKSGDHLSVDVRLVQAADGRTLWSSRVDLSPHDVLGLETTISGSLTRKLQSAGGDRTNGPLPAFETENAEAYYEYLKGRYFWNKRTDDTFVRAIACFNHAIALDPKYARAYAGLGDTYSLLGSLPNAGIPRNEAMPKAKEAALTALQLDESLAEAHTSLAFVEMQYEWDWPGAEKEFKRAIELNPNYATAHQWYAIWLMAQGRPAAALAEEQRAQEADPLSIIIKTDTAQLLVYAGRYDEAEQQALSALEIDQNFALAHIYLAEARAGKQDYPAAISEFQKALAINKEDVWALSGLGLTYALTNQRRKSEDILRDFLNGAENQNGLAIEVARTYAGLGESDKAIAWLRKAYQYRNGGMILFNLDPAFQNLRPDSRFADLEHLVGLPHADTKR
jgi:DNA-binding winged helix-turn-helix (wHTH) protein/TolB-like protein/Flp pilus assembly protein TadD